MTPIVGVLLAAGLGQRFDRSGVRFKLTEPVNATQTVITRSAELLAAACDQLVIVHGPRSIESWQATQHLNAIQLSCPQAHLGMGASLKAAVSAVATPRLGWLVALADMPYIHSSTYQALVQCLQEGCLLARPVYEGQPGHPVVIHHSLGAELLGLDDAVGAQPLFARYREQTQWLPSEDEGCVRDIDVPADLSFISR